MSKLFPICTILALGTLTAAAVNQWGAYAAFWDTGDAGSGYGGGAKVSAELVPNVQLQLRGTYFTGLGEGAGDADVDLKIAPLEAGLALGRPVTDNVSVYGGVGLGYYLVDGEVKVPEGSEGLKADPGDEIGVYLAGGLEWAISRSGASYGETAAVLFAELMYRFVSVDDLKVETTPDGDIRLSDADLNGIGVHLGLMIRW